MQLSHLYDILLCPFSLVCLGWNFFSERVHLLHVSTVLRAKGTPGTSIQEPAIKEQENLQATTESRIILYFVIAMVAVVIIRQHLEYHAQIWATQHRKDKGILGLIRCRDTKTAKGWSGSCTRTGRGNQACSARRGEG